MSQWFTLLYQFVGARYIDKLFILKLYQIFIQKNRTKIQFQFYMRSLMLDGVPCTLTHAQLATYFCLFIVPFCLMVLIRIFSLANCKQPEAHVIIARYKIVSSKNVAFRLLIFFYLLLLCNLNWLFSSLRSYWLLFMVECHSL